MIFSKKAREDIQNRQEINENFRNAIKCRKKDQKKRCKKDKNMLLTLTIIITIKQSIKKALLKVFTRQKFAIIILTRS